MKKQKIFLAFLLIITFFSIAFISHTVFATSISDLIQQEELSDEFLEWLELSDEEKENTIMPLPYDVKYTKTVSTNPLLTVKLLKASVSSSYNLQDIIPNNVVVKNQMTTNSCWAFAAISSLETNLALYDYKNGSTSSTVYDFSERHMEYATSNVFKNNTTNATGYNRQIGSGGNCLYALSYLTNGIGAIAESEMPFENNEDLIDISALNDKTVSSQVYDTIIFPDYSDETGTNRTNIMNQIKQHIQNYGSVSVIIHGASVGASCYNNTTGALYCSDTSSHTINHAVSIIGWDDNYSIDNFNEDSRPSSNGAWIVRNSWGEAFEYDLATLKATFFNTYSTQLIALGYNSASEIPDSLIEQNGYTIDGDKAYLPYGDDGIIYISYEDVNVASQVFGIIKASNTTDYEYIYQYDMYYPIIMNSFSSSSVMLATLFDKETTDVEYLTQVALYSMDTCTCEVYINPNGSSLASSDLQKVKLEVGDTETITEGYHTLEFAEPIELTSDTFAVVIKLQSSDSNLSISFESSLSGYSAWDSVTVETGKCFIAVNDDLSNCTWCDTSELNSFYSSASNGDTTVKAFTTTTLEDNTLTSIAITTPPNKTTYIEGEDFDKTGMVVTAYYDSNTNSSVILDDASYSITNGSNLKVGQKTVTITYENMSVTQAITVEENSIVSLEIVTPPTTTSYIEGQSFDKTGMVIQATYKDGSTKIITDYTIENGNNLVANQSTITISYDGIEISQAITVTSNSLISIAITNTPTKTVYVIGQSFDSSGMIVTGTYQDGSTQEIIDYTIVDGSALKLNQTYVTIEYNGKVTTQSISVIDKTVTSISISSLPTKLSYIQGEEDLSLEGGVLKIIYNDASTENISLSSSDITVTGFDNSILGKQTLTVTYLSKTTQFEIEIIENEEEEVEQEEVDEEKVAENSNFDNIKLSVEKILAYYFTSTSTDDYTLIDTVISGITPSSSNDSVEYYYYLSTSQNEQYITNWIKIPDAVISNGSLSFTIDSRDVSNFDTLSGESVVYLYLREVAINGGNQSVYVSDALQLETTTSIETYLDSTKVTNYNSSNTDNTDETDTDDTDTTVITGILPQTGVGNLLAICLVIISILGVIFYIRYKFLNKYTKN